MIMDIPKMEAGQLVHLINSAGEELKYIRAANILVIGKSGLMPDLVWLKS
jgi:hypothetical protein